MLLKMECQFFKRLGMGVFDIENLKETNNLIDFIEKAIVDYHLNRDELIILGYSNGANIMASMFSIMISLIILNLLCCIL